MKPAHEQMIAYIQALEAGNKQRRGMGDGHRKINKLT